MSLPETRWTASTTERIEAARRAYPGDADELVLLRFAEFEHRYICQQIALADAKANAIFAGASFVLALGMQIFGPATLSDPWSLTGLSAGLGLLLVAASAVAAFLVLLPRHSPPRDDLVYFRDVAARPDAAHYIAEVSQVTQSAPSTAELLLKGVFMLARLCDKKFGLLRVSLLSFACGIVVLALRLAV